MLYSEIIAVCSQIHTKHIITLRGQNTELLNIRMVVCIVTTSLYLKVLDSNFMSVQHSPPTDPNPSQTNSPHSNIPCFFIIYFNITVHSHLYLGLARDSLSQVLRETFCTILAPAYGLVV
jgi:hypothetical protein